MDDGGRLTEEVERTRCVLTILRMGLLIACIFLIAHGWEEQAFEYYMSLRFSESCTQGEF